MAKKRVMMTLDEGLLQRMEKACASQGITKSAYVSMVVAKDLGDTEIVLDEFKKQLEKMLSEAGLSQKE